MAVWTATMALLIPGGLPSGPLSTGAGATWPERPADAWATSVPPALARYAPTVNPPVTQTLLPAAVLWDMDGTLVDTEPYWIDTEFALAEKYGGTWSHEHALNLVGNALLDSGDYIRVHMGIDRTPQQIVDELLDGVVARVAEDVPWRPGARELLDDLRAEGVPCALVTMSWQRFVDPILAQLPADTFATVVTGDRVEFGKPHPSPT